MTEDNLNAWNKAFENKKAQYIKIVPSYVKEVPEDYVKKVVKNVLTNTLLEPCFSSTIGKMSIYSVVEDIIRLGLNYDTNKKLTQCYVTPRKEKQVIEGKDTYIHVAEMSIRAPGSIFVAKSMGVIKGCTWATVYENHKPVTINSDGSYVLNIDDERYRAAGGEMGAYFGTIVSVTDSNEIVHTKYFPKSWLDKRKAFGDSKMKRDPEKTTGAWQWFEEMAEAKTVNKMLEPFINESAQLSAIYGNTKQNEPPTYDQIVERASEAGAVQEEKF
jgi:hypothetical protein